MITVVLVAFLPAATGSFVWVLGSSNQAVWRNQFSWSTGAAVVYLLSALLLTGYVLSQRGETLRDLGLCWRWWVLPVSMVFPLFFYMLSWVSLSLVVPNDSVTVTNDTLTEHIAFLGASPWPLSAAMMIMSPIVEEFVGRAYVIVGLRQIGWSSASAVIGSTALLTEPVPSVVEG